MSSDVRIDSHRSRGLSLIEILVVVVIASLLAATSTSVLSIAKIEAKKTNTISNLRQCGLALLLYSEEAGGPQYMPPGSVAMSVLSNGITCDLNDYWRPSCAVQSSLPQVGSYGYVPAIVEYMRRDPTETVSWESYLQDHEKVVLMLSPFYGPERVCPFRTPPSLGEGWYEWIQGCRSRGFSTRMPARIPRLLLDGSVEIRQISRQNWLMGAWESGLMP